MNPLLIKTCDIIAKSTGIGTYCTLCLLDEEGYPTSSVITASQAKGIFELFFCTGIGTIKSNKIKRHNKASVCFSSIEYSINLVGTIDISVKPEIKSKMWYGGLNSHFTGPEDPNYCVLHFKTKKYSIFVDWIEQKGNIDNLERGTYE